jgi:hypothetical protein
MRLVSCVLVLGALSLAAPASAALVFSDNFDGEADGFSSLNYDGFANFSVIGKVDVVKSGDYGITCSGSCVDLDGSTGPGRITSLQSFAFSAGDIVRYTITLGGNQRNVDSDGFFLGFSFDDSTSLVDYGYNFANLGGNDQIVYSGTTRGISTSFAIAGNQSFGSYSLFFKAGDAGTLNFFTGTGSADNVGPLLDKVTLSITNAAVPEPAAWAMMLAGFGLVGTAMRRRQKMAVTFA